MMREPNTVDDPVSLGVTLQWGIKIPTRDGVRLSASLYLPKICNASAPCLFSLTPYTVHRGHYRASFFARHGFPFLIVDARGRGNSEGIFRPFIQEAEDGFDIVEWIAQQPYCNGKVAMFGGSYLGYAQWVTAKMLPPHLLAIAPAVAAAPGVEGNPMRGNIAYPYVMRWLTSVSGRAHQERIFEDQAFWRQQFRDWFESGRPFKALDAIVGNPSAIFQEWVSHPDQDEYWDRFRPAVKDYAKIDLPILTITGMYDADQLGALHYYREHHRHSPSRASAKHYLVIGPWNHTGALAPTAAVGGLEFGSSAVMDILKLHVEWYNWTMRGGPKPGFLCDRVSYYVTGAEKWRYANSLEAVTGRLKPLYLDSMGTASHVFASGRLQESTGSGEPDQYVYDPRDRSIAVVESRLSDPFTILRPTFPIDDPLDPTLVYASEGKVLIYHSAPVRSDTELSGFFRLIAWISIDQRDTDFMATVYEITDDGRSILLTTDVMRARYRESLREQKLVHTGEPLRYDFNGFTFASRQLRRGSRLRLVLGPVNSIYAQRNYNSGGTVSEESIADARTVTVRLFHDRSLPSALYVPIGMGVEDQPWA